MREEREDKREEIKDKREDTRDERKGVRDNITEETCVFIFYWHWMDPHEGAIEFTISPTCLSYFCGFV